ncbi:phosphoglycerate mutase-like protein [Stereum hirsutum FP-91666 SS1]|uniref:phosphoglycerate mutase-like protein n=1 Tax=Stereum hirsutum (strain FP-91666) TaxID=721885 RepID=UPI000444A776|nr:phosphoglycerate mutase-like protein [Stereum hirsutum FP-91666 SS1]EIM82959.1 phosphoglycerate mutase-like protein [Stereum hirsutum FP-91666 SS1]
MFPFTRLVFLVASLHLVQVSAYNVPRAVLSSSAGETTSFAFLPNATVTVPDPNFPEASVVGFPGPTPTGDEAEAIATATALSKVDSAFPLVRPDTEDHKGKTFNVEHYWGNLSPMFSLDAGTFGLNESSPLIPEGCSLTQAHLLHRHGARYPTTGAAPAQLAAALHNANTTVNVTGPLEFLSTWTYKLGAEILTPFGREQLYGLGVGFRVRYGELLKGFNDFPVWRTTSEGNLQFAAGFFGVQSYQTSYHQLIEIESSGFNSTLAPYDVCTNANNAVASLGSTQANAWAEIYTAPTIERLSKHITGLNLTASTIIAMQETCAYETVALGFSSFCALFTEEEWKQFEYFLDVSFWYGNGPGNPAVAAQGIGWVQELVSRLTRTPISTFDTSVNETIVTSNVTFPLSQPIFVDATHDTIISAIVTAMNLSIFSAPGPLPTDHIPDDQTWIVPHISPFGSNMVGQVLSCPASDTPTHIRFVLNDAVLPLTGIQGCTADKNGLCEIDKFISGLQARIEEVDYQFDCFANYTVPVPDDITDGRFPDALKNSTSAK